MNYYKLVKPVLALIVLLFLFSLWQRVPDIDDGWIGEHGYWMAKQGYVKSELMHGITQEQIRHIVHHKFFTLNGATFIKLFGFSLYTLKSVSLFWTIIFFIIFYYYVRKKYGQKVVPLSMLLLIGNAFIFQYSFVYRPEIMVMTLGFISFIFLEKYLEDSKSVNLIISGFIAGLAAAGHLNGLIFIGAGVLSLIWKKKYLAGFLFGLYSIPGFAVYFYDFTKEYNFKFWLYQVSEAPSFHKKELLPGSLQYFFKILREHLRFFHSPKEIIMTLLLIFSVGLNFKYLKEKTIYLHYLLILIVLLSLITAHSTTKYLLLFIPVITLIILPAVKMVFDRNLTATKHFNSKQLYKTGIVLITGFLFIHSIYNAIISFQKFDPRINSEITQKYFRNSEELSILAPIGLVLNELPKYKRIQSDLSLIEMNQYNNISSENFFLMVDTLKLDGMMISEEYIMKFGLTSVTDQEYKEMGFNVTGREDGYLFLRKQ